MSAVVYVLFLLLGVVIGVKPVFLLAGAVIASPILFAGLRR